MKKRVLLVLLSAFLSIMVNAQIQEEQKIISGERTEDAEFGTAVGIYKNYAIAGEPNNDTDENSENNLDDAGAAYIFEKDIDGNWIRVQKLVAPDRVTDGMFGYDVAIYDSTVFIGSDKKKVYVFEKDENDAWVHKQTISESGGQTFGQHVSIHNNYAIIGDTYAWGTFSGGYQYPAGAAYIYEKDGTGVWNLNKKIMASDYASYDNFGESVDIFNDYAVVGNSRHDNSTGSVYVFKRSAEGVWSEVQKLLSPTPETWEAYGKTVAVSDSVIAVGSIGEDYDVDDKNYMADAGAVYIYNITSHDTCAYSEKLVAPVRNAMWDYFGSSISLNKNYLIVGAGKEDEDSNNENTLEDAGATYIFEKTSSGNWSLSFKLTPADRVETDLFGHDVAIYNEEFIVGAPQGDLDSISNDSIDNAGCAYIYKLQTLPSITVQPTDQSDICNGSETTFSVDGSRIENYQWQVSNNGGSTWANITDDDVYSGTATNTLTIKTGTDLNNNQYFCNVSNSFGDLNSDTATLTVTNDTESPSITSTHDDVVLDVDENCEASLSDYTGDVMATDNCDADLDITQSPVAGSSISGATNTVTLTVTDDVGNESSVSFNVAAEDNTNPVISSTHSDQTINSESNCDAGLPDYTGDIVAADNCDADLEITQSPVAGSSISGATNSVTLTVTDDAGNTDEVTFNVAVVDNINPTISCPENKTVNLNIGQTVYAVDGTEFDPVSTEDNCGVASITNNFNNLSSLNGAELPIGTTSIIWTVTDNEGNENTCSYDVTVNESTTSITTLHQNGISIYPNPTKGVINLDNTNNNIQVLIISDMSGKHIFEKHSIPKHESIDLSELKSGIYLMSIQTDNEILTTRIIKE